MNPETREEKYLAKMAGEDVSVPEPITRKEKWYEKIINAISSGGGGSYPPAGGVPRSDLAADVRTSLSKADTATQPPEAVTTGTDITLADNTEYKLTDVSTLTLSFPSGNFECWISISTAASGTISVTLPLSAAYIGEAPVFGNGETWEISVKNGVVVAAKVGDGT